MHLRPLFSLVLLVAALAAGLGCDPHLPAGLGGPLTRLDAGGEADGGSGGLVVSVEPPAPLDGAPRVLRLHASFDGFTFDPTRIALVSGSIVPRQLHELAEGKPSAALTKRLLPSVAWSEGAGEALAPTAPLDAGATYTLVMADLPAALEVTIASMDTVPLLPRVWPPSGASATARFAVWCASDPVPAIDARVTLMPDGLRGRIVDRIVANGAGRDCVRFEADAEPAADAGATAPSVPPPVVASEQKGALLRLDPRPLTPDVAPSPLPKTPCFAGEIAFGPGCATVLDDRVVGRSASVPLLWAVAGPDIDAAFTTDRGDPFVVTGLPPAAHVALDVAAFDAAGSLVRARVSATTLPPAPHVAINEVLAWPLGPSPDQEWVEIVNDGPAPAELDGYVLQVGTTPTPLPAATLAPGEYALVVGEAFSTADGLDVAPAPGTLLLTVPHLGAKGLSKKGEVFTLLDASSNPVSSFPATPKPKQGESVARRTPSAPDALASSFARATPSPGRKNTW